MGYILTGAVMVSGTYVGDDGIERRYEIVRGQNVASLNLPPHAEKELRARVRPMGGRRGTPIPYFTHVDDAGKPSAPEADRSITVASLNEGIQASRVAAGVVEPEEEFTKILPVVEEEPVVEDDKPATTPEEAEVAVTEEPAAEPVVSPTEEEAVKCANPDCGAEGDTDACDSEECPVNEAPAEEAPTEEAPVASEAPVEVPKVEKPKAPKKKSAKKKK